MNHKMTVNDDIMVTTPLSLYIHMPWCIRKCPYCDFNSHQKTTALPIDEYIDALIADAYSDLEVNEEPLKSRSLQSVFFGGGTPSLIPADAIDALLIKLRDVFTFNDDIEITLEVNPGAAEYNNLKGLASAGVNRVSLGAQSFNDLQLHKLGRIHSAGEIYSAYEAIARAGIETINIDIMHGLPGQTVSEALQDLDTAISLRPQHISWYELTIEPNTVFYRKPPELPDDDTQAEMYKYGREKLHNRHYLQYEVSAYSLTNYQSQHNLNYWQFGDYIGLGAGAHSKITHANGVIYRAQKTRRPEDFMHAKKEFTARRWQVDHSDLPFEFMMNALRLKGGVDYSLYQSRTALATSTIDKKVELLQRKGLMRQGRDRLQTSDKGFQFLNDVLKEFMIRN